MLLATVTWINPAGGDWSTPSDWSSQALPGPNDDVVINALNPGASVTHTQNVTDTIHSLTAAAPITLSEGELNLSGGTGTPGALSDTGPFSLAGGILSLADVQAGTVLTASSAAEGTLNQVTLGGSLSVSNTAISVTGGMTLANGAQVAVGNASSSGEIVVQGNQMIGGTGDFTFAGVGGTLEVIGNVTLGPGVIVDGTTGTINIQSGSLVNQGTIDSNGGGTISLQYASGTSWTNASGGIFQADGGSTLSIGGTSGAPGTGATGINAAGGVLQAAGGSTLTLGTAWSNAGTIVVTNSTLNLWGSFTTAGLGSYTPTGSTINLTGTLDNTGATLILDAATGSWNLVGGTLDGGALATLDGTSLASSVYGGTLEGLTLGATVSGQAQPGNMSVATGDATVTGGLTLTNGSVVQIDAVSFPPLLVFQGNETIGGNGQIQFAGPGGELEVIGNVIVGPGVSVDGTSGTLSIQSGSLVNQGTIDSDGGGTVSIQGSTGTTWSNTGLITATNNSTIDLGDTFKTSEMGTIVGTDGVVSLTGTLINDETLALTDATGSFYLGGGTIDGGTVTTSGDAELLGFIGGTLNAVTLDGTLNDGMFPALGLNITNGLTLNGGTITIAGTNDLEFAGTQTLSGSGTVSVATLSNSVSLVVDGTGDSLTIAPGITIQGHGFVGEVSGGSVTINGTIAANDGGALIVQGCTNFANGTLTGGTWEASNNSTLRIIGAQIATNAASVLLSGSQSHIYSDAATTNALGSLSANADGSQVTVTGGANLVDTASLTNAGTVTLGPNSSLTVAAYTQTGGGTGLQGGTLATSQSAGVDIEAGTFSGPGSVQGDLTNAAALDLGTAVGTLSVTGDYTQTATGTMSVKLGGTAPGTQYDQVNLTGPASLDGTLDINLVNGFGPSIGQTFQVLSFADSVGSFATVNGLAPNNQATLEPISNPTNVTLKAISTAPNLVPVDVIVPSGTVVPGQPITIGYTITNQGATGLSGNWVDSVFLSSTPSLDASALFIGQVQHTGGLGGNSSYTGSLTAPLPGVLDGKYYVLVEADSQDVTPDSNRSNSVLAATSLLSVTIPTLTLGTSVTGTVAAGQDVYYQLNLASVADVEIAGDYSVAGEANLLVRYLALPDSSDYDEAATDPSSANPQITLAQPQGGAYYLLIQGQPGAGSGQAFTLGANDVPFAIDSVSPTQGSNSGQATITVAGSDFTPQTVVQLHASNGTVLDASTVQFQDDTTLFATFNLTGLTPGTYDVRAIDPNSGTVADPGAFTVVSGNPGHLQAFITTAAFIRLNQPDTTVTINYENTGDTDIPAPLLTLFATNAVMRLPSQDQYVGSTIQVLAIDQNGPAGTLPPGYQGTITVDYQYTPPQGSDPQADFHLSLPPAPTTPINWSSFEASTQPSDISSAAWNVIWNNFTAAVGPTFGQYQAALDNLATYFSQIGIYTPDVNRLFDFALDQADAALPTPTLGSTVDASLPTPGLALTFERTFQQPISGRYQLGPFGRGWTDNWAISATTDSQGNVTVDEGGAILSFALQANGTYEASPGENETLTMVAGAYQLREADGTILAFNPNGTLNDEQDPNNNRITAGYTSGQLTSLTDSNGASLTLTYNSQGFISQITDSTGRVTTYTYDASGQLLLSVTSPVENVQYTYVTGQNPAQQYALASITNMGIPVYYTYDAEGRLIEQSQAGGVEAVTYGYGPGGTLTTTDATGDTTTQMFNDFGEAAVTVDALGQTTKVAFDTNGNPVQEILPDGTSESQTFNEQNDLTSQIDPLGQAIGLTYDPSFNELTSFTDALGDATTYDYDSQGNLLSITAADGTSQQYVRNSEGEVTQYTNADDQTITYTYNAAGLVTSQTFPDSTSTQFTYDAHGNLLSAIDASGTITLTWATDGGPGQTSLLASVTYPDGMYLDFTYNADGERTQMVDQSGYTVNYQYDAAGRLIGMTDGSGAPIVQYTYDADGRLAEVQNGNGTYTTYSYDADGQVLALINYGPRPSPNQPGPVLSQFDYTYDALGRPTSETTLQGTITYGYDANSELDSIKLPTGEVITYQYDAAGNRVAETDNGVTTSYTTNDVNEYTSIGAATDTYDAAGNLVSTSGPSGTTTFTYDALGRLTGVTTPTGTWSYQYDALGDLISVAQNGQKTQYLVDPTSLASVVGEYDGAGNLIAHFTQGLGLVSQVNASGSAAYYNFDASGNTVGLSGSSGSYLNSYSYLPFGQVLSATGTIANPFQFGGQLGVMTQSNGLDMMRARFYDPTTGRFLSRDPIGISGGTNLYAYAKNSPVTYQDPQGNSPDTGAVTFFGSGVLASLPEVASAAAGLGGVGLGALGFAVGSWGFFIYELATWPPTPPTVTTGPNGQQIPVTPDTPIDPNFISGPAGYGPQGFVEPETALPYQIGFENESDATAPAQVVEVTQQLDPNLDWSTFQLGDFGFGSQAYAVPAGLTSYSVRIDATSAVGVYVDVTAQFDVLTGVLTWTFTSIDPTSLDIPVGNVLEGFLPPDETPPEGEGWVSYTIQPKGSDTTGTVINAQATVIFDAGLSDQSSLATGSIFNTIDTGPPTSSVNPLPVAVTTTSLNVSWSGQDDPGGSGIASYNVFVSDDGGPFTPFVTDTTATSATFTGQYGHTYGFYAIATDNVGNVQTTPTAAQATTQVVLPLTVNSIAEISPNPRNTAVTSIDVTFSEPINPSSLSSGSLTLTDNGWAILINDGVSLSLVSGTTATYAISGLSGLTTAQGQYTLIVNAADIQDQNGNLGTGSLSTSWLMDTTAPSSHVINALGTSQTSDSFPVSVTFSDPTDTGRAPASGVSSVSLYDSVNNGPFSLYQTLTLTTPTASGTVTFTFVGQDRNIYAFHSIAEDAAGNVEIKSSTAIEASTSVPDLHPPVTHILASSPMYSWGPFPSSEFSGLTPSSYSNGVFTLDWAGADPDQDSGTPAGSIALVNVYVAIDGGTPSLIGQLNGGKPNGSSVYSGSMTYDALGDGLSHTYSFFSVGIDDEQKVQYAPQSGPSTPDVTFTESYTAPLAVEDLMVEKGIAERSFIQYLDVDFNQSLSTNPPNSTLQGLANGLTGSSASSYVELLWYGENLTANSSPKGSVNLFNTGTTANLSLAGNDLSINFGPNGITSLLTETGVSGTGSPTSSFGDGWYALGIDPTGNASNHQVFWLPFFRLLGSATGDLTVSGPYTASGTDAYTVYHAEGETSPLLDADVNGDGAVNSNDLTETVEADNHAVGTTEPGTFPAFQLFAGATSAPGHAVAITQAEVKALLPAAIDAWRAAGLGAADVRELEGVSVQVGNLGTSILGLETAGTITINQTAAGYNWYVNASTGSNQASGLVGPGGETVARAGSPAADDVDLLTVLEHELGHVIGLADNTQAGDLMDITLGLGVRRSPTAADLTSIAGVSNTAVWATSPAFVPTIKQQPVLLNGSVSVSGATVDAALASIASAAVGNDDPYPTVKPGAPAVSVGPVPGPGVPPRKRYESPRLSRPYPQRIGEFLFPRKSRYLAETGRALPGTAGVA
jgi:RHS repeat-associated protein